MSIKYFGYDQIKIVLFYITHEKEPEKYLIPVDGKKKSDIKDEFNVVSANGRKHEGTDIFAPKGTPIRACVNSIITTAIPEEIITIGGNYIWALGEGRIIYLYSHLSRFEPGAKRGKLVRQGEIIGYVGNTGNAKGTSPHLHFGMYKARLNSFFFFSRTAINPFNFLVKPLAKK